VTAERGSDASLDVVRVCLSFRCSPAQISCTEVRTLLENVLDQCAAAAPVEPSGKRMLKGAKTMLAFGRHKLGGRQSLGGGLAGSRLLASPSAFVESAAEYGASAPGAAAAPPPPPPPPADPSCPPSSLLPDDAFQRHSAAEGHGGARPSDIGDGLAGGVAVAPGLASSSGVASSGRVTASYPDIRSSEYVIDFDRHGQMVHPSETVTQVPRTAT
jgi:hypothetical protein